MTNQDKEPDLYEVLQLNVNADVETVHRVYRLLAQRLHPDNRETGNTEQFRALTDAYNVLSDPEKRARYDITYHQQKRDRVRLVEAGAQVDNDFQMEQRLRLTVLEVLYTRRRTTPGDPGIFNLDLAELTGTPREHLEFTLWYLTARNLAVRTDNSRLAITAAGADYLEEHYQAAIQRKRLQASTLPT
jgi:curved DNA-binding protein CbpA